MDGHLRLGVNLKMGHVTLTTPIRG